MPGPEPRDRKGASPHRGPRRRRQGVEAEITQGVQIPIQTVANNTVTVTFRDAALTLVDAHGVEALSMRRLGAALGRDPMRLYRHASSKDDLLDGIVESWLGPIAMLSDQEIDDVISSQPLPGALVVMV